ncbi:MAG TPA: hypothetical protein PK251_13030 [Candidatus Latescibacteria bacterium]|jgi:hypothetical protein|nr:hypothetical protein [Candidatus Latescibacterota bacterium]HOT36519.1 hypothetical protein [Candidatus Latescibacterota bacterium]HPC45233.1 hypothetical protein [Candidatus Latescibacterota bacterium]HPK75563.1 hypothetical protein [Candidatus Latescibacterota bacterium]HRS95145.1 hypothetical protein [Candidatus Latescibacterota bacterium]
MNYQRHAWGWALAAACAVGLLNAPAHAIAGFGIHAGKDFVSISEGSFDRAKFEAAGTRLGLTGVNWANWNSVTLTRKEISSPWLIGVHAYIDAIPYIDLEVSVDGAISQYRVDYRSTLNPAVNESKDVYFGRVGAYGTVRRDIVKFPPVVPIAALYFGGGLSYNFIAPVAGPDLIVNAYGTDNPTTRQPDIAKLVEREGTFGWHGLVGFRIKPPVVPIALRLEGKYTSTGISTYERPKSIFSAYLGTSFAF